LLILIISTCLPTVFSKLGLSRHPSQFFSSSSLKKTKLQKFYKRVIYITNWKMTIRCVIHRVVKDWKFSLVSLGFDSRIDHTRDIDNRSKTLRNRAVLSNAPTFMMKIVNEGWELTSNFFYSFTKFIFVIQYTKIPNTFFGVLVPLLDFSIFLN
jgi:hypothetical protein